MTMLADLRYAARMLRQSRVVTLVSLLCISIGAGAVTTIVSAMNAVVLRPLPGASHQDRLISIDRRSPDDGEGVQGSYALYERLAEATPTLEGVGAWSKVDLAIATRDGGHAVYGNIVSGNYFDVLGVRPAAGRFFRPEEGRTPMAHPVVVVSYGFWTSVLGADPAAIGSAVTVNGYPFTLIGVAPPGFRGAFTPLKVEAWVPLMMQPILRPGRDLTRSVWLWTFGRMKPGVTRAQASAELTAIVTGYAAAADDPDSYRRYTWARVTPLSGLPEDARTAFLGFAGIFLAAATLVLLIACVNVGSVLSARAVGRQRELAIRAALGASRGRLARQLLTESLLLFLLGAPGAIGLAIAATAGLERLPIPGDTPLLLEVSPDGRVLAFALGLSLLTGVVFGVGPALRASRPDVTTPLKSESPGSGSRRGWFARGVIAAQLALAVLLLVAGGLFTRALHSGATTDPGFETRGVTIATINTEAWGYDHAKGRVFFDRLAESLAATPGVASVSFAGIVPLTLSSSGAHITVDTGGSAPEDWIMRSNVVGTGYFDTMEIPLVAGRDFRQTDDEQAPRVAIVNETLARRFGPGRDALGRTFVDGGDRYTVVGIARDAKYASFDEPTPSFVYFPMRQRWSAAQTVFVRGTGSGHAIDTAVRTIDPMAPLPAVIPLTEATGMALLPQQAAAWVAGSLGAVGLLLSAVGLYGVLAYSVSRRRREIGVRMALGATWPAIVRLIVSEGLWLAGIGLIGGLLLAVGATRVIASLLLDVSPLDPLTFAAMSAVFLAITVVACGLPARRAAGEDPVAALRD